MVIVTIPYAMQQLFNNYVSFMRRGDLEERCQFLVPSLLYKIVFKSLPVKPDVICWPVFGCAFLNIELSAFAHIIFIREAKIQPRDARCF